MIIISGLPQEFYSCSQKYFKPGWSVSGPRLFIYKGTKFFMPTAERIGELIFRFLRGELNPQEVDELESWKNASPANSRTFYEMTDKATLRHDLKEIYEQEEAVWAKLKERIPGLREPVIRKKNKLVYWFAAAAVALLLFGIGYSLLERKGTIQLAGKPGKTMIIPGGNHAFLTLGNGRKIVLDSTANGSITAKIVKKDSAELIYSAAVQTGGHTAPLNTLSTPRGGQYKVTLPDGTQVWLNAASSITYPEYFPGGERNVSLTGEAYFEVAKDAKKPFRVLVNNKTTVEVLGTHFNIMAYTDEPFEATTLLEGSVRINGSLLRPGEQAMVDPNNNISIIQADLKSAVAWKNGITSFSGADIRKIMRIVSRWYDVDVSYSGNIPAAPDYVGGIPRNTSLDNVLKALQISGIHFTITGKKVIVSP
jgi:transmembrane sensor